MDTPTAQLLLNNLLDRIVTDPETGQKTLPGILTAREIEALEFAAKRLPDEDSLELIRAAAATDKPMSAAGQQPGQEGKNRTEERLEPLPEMPAGTPGHNRMPDRQPADTAPLFREPTPVTPDLTALEYDQPQQTGIKMCLDFGTAMSKAFASQIEDGEIIDGLKLKLGYRASGGKSRDIYPVPSSLWISEDGLIYFGEQAVAKSLLTDPSRTRERFDSLKRELILGMKEDTPFGMMMNQNLNPTDCPLSKGDAIILYLGYLTDLACSEMEDQYGCSRYVVRNFGLPSWDTERRIWGEKLLRTMLVKAQIVADTFHGQWKNGVDIHAVKSVLEQIDTLQALPEYLVGQGITEPLAVGSARLHRDEPHRGLVMVVDVGAGTSDLALFIVAADPSRNLFNAFPVRDCNQSLHMAGDTLDSALQQIILKKAGVNSHDHDFPYILRQLRLQLRTLKEEVFLSESCAIRLVNGSRIHIGKEEFLLHSSVQRFGQQLQKKFTDVISPMTNGLVNHFGDGGLSVVLTGGGATLPMVKELASGSCTIHKKTVRKHEVPMVPEDFEYDEELAKAYPQLAVAIGGTMPRIIDEKNTVDDFDIPRGQFTLNRAQVTGI